MTDDLPPSLFRVIGPAVRGGALVLRLEGELDFASIPEFEEATAAIPSAARLLVDLRALQFIDSTGVSALVRLHQQMAGGGGTLGCVVAAGGLPRRLFELTGLDDLLELVDAPPDPA
jgi:anti-sigma B factor antagonist